MKNINTLSSMIQFTRRSVAIVLLATASICAWGTDVNISVTFNSSNKPQNGITLSKDAVDYGTVSCNTASSNRAIIRNTSSLTIAATKIGWTVKSIALTWRGSSNDPTSTDVLTITGGSFNSLTSITGSSASVVIGSGSTNNNYQVSAVSVTFTDGGGGDVTPPTLVSSSPANSATGVAVSGNITLTFSENVTVNDASKFTLSGGAGSLTTASISASGAVVTIPYTGLANNTTYTLSTAAEAVKDAANNKNAALSNISFTTVAASCTSITPTFSTDYTSLTLTVGGGNSSTPAINKDGSEGGITWSSSAEGVATVSNTGVVSPVKAGTATITATVAAAGGKCEGSVSRTFTVNAAGVDWIIKVALSGSAGATKTMSGTIGGTAACSGLGSSSPYKIGGDAAYVSLTLATGYFQAGDSVVLDLSKTGQIFYGASDNDTDHLLGTTTSKSGIHYFVLPETFPANTNTIHVGRTSSTYNGTLTYMTVYRPVTIPPCTTPVLPTLSNQTVCPGSDIAAWDATQTASLAEGETVAYEWKKKGSETVLASTATFDLGSSATAEMAGTYVVTATVSKTGCTSKSASKEVTLTVSTVEEPSISANKATVYPGNSVTLTATCGTAGVTWKWYTCTNAAGDGESEIGSATSAEYTIASAGSVGIYYYKVKATLVSCGSAEHVYTLNVTAADECTKEFWFAKEADRPSGAAEVTHITNTPSGSSSASYTASIDGTDYTITGQTGQKTGNITIVVPEDNTGTLYVVVQGSSNRTITLSKGETQVGQETPANSTWGVYTFSGLDAGTYKLVSGGNIGWAIIALKLCPTVTCYDALPAVSATNETICVGGTTTLSATGYEDGATLQWQKQNSTSGAWENISGATNATYVISSAAAEHAGNYHVVATKNCSRTSSTLAIAVPATPVFNSFSTSRRVMATQTLYISDVSATDAVSYTWYKSTDATWDAGDTEIGTEKNLAKPSAGEVAGNTYYVFCRATNSCGTTTSAAIEVNVQTYVMEDCAVVGNNGAHNTYYQKDGEAGTFGSVTEVHISNSNKYIYYVAESGYFFATATVNVAVGNASNLSTAAYSYSTDGGSTWVDENFPGMTQDYEDHEIEFPSNVNAFRIGRRLGEKGTSSSKIYIHQVCFTYNETCTKTDVVPSAETIDYTIGDDFTEPTFIVKYGATAFDPQPTITYTSSDESIATVDETGKLDFKDKAGTLVITASYAGDATYCASEGSYTVSISCSDEAPKIIAADGTNIGGCNSSITLLMKKQDGTSDFDDGSYQWYRNGIAIDGATSTSYVVTEVGEYTVERTNISGCISPSSNAAMVTSDGGDPVVERLTPFQYYHAGKTYTEQMKMRHLFAVKNSGTSAAGKPFDMKLSKNGGAATDVTSDDMFVMDADTVLLDLNKMTGKGYTAGDELVLTCSAIECSGAVSGTYKNTITIYVIDDKPTLALICSGAKSDGTGTRKTNDMVVGGDFLTGWNPADLCLQTGNTSFDKNTEWSLYTKLKVDYHVTPVNGYANFNKLNYEPFDILFLTDYPKASRSEEAKTILDDMADLCDYRPLFTFKTHMVAKSPSKWAAKGFKAEPTVPDKSALRLNIVCYAHPMFAELKNDHTLSMMKDAGDPSQIVYEMLSGAGYEGSGDKKKGIQGFPIDAAEGFVTIGLIHFNATPIDNSPSTGYVTWTPGSGDYMMVAAAERQVNPEARMILFSVNAGAQSKLNATGETIVMKSLEYLLTDAATTMAECSISFTNGEGNAMSQSQYETACPACTGTKGDGLWSTAANWGPDYILVPGENTDVKVKKPVTVDMDHAKVRSIRLVDDGRVTIQAEKALEVTTTIRRLDEVLGAVLPTQESDLLIEASDKGSGSLILDNNAGDTRAQVQFYSKAFIDRTDPLKPKGVKNYQYIGTPFTSVNAHQYYNAWLYSWNGTKWAVVPNGETMTPWTGYCITQENAGTVYNMSGTLEETNSKDISVPASGDMVVGNSWTAPIYIGSMTTADFENLNANVYFFNTGVEKEHKLDGHIASTRFQAGTYVTAPINSAPFTGDDYIASMQGFFVSSPSSAGTLHLDYEKHVRPSSTRSIVSGELHAPSRRMVSASGKPEVLKITVSGENYDDRLILLAREDFSEGFDNGWDGDKWDGNAESMFLYTKDERGVENSVSAVPDMEGTVIGFRAGEDDEYTMYFERLNSEEEFYLYDMDMNIYTQIADGAAYHFATSDKDKHDRFIITRRNPNVATGMESLDTSQGGRVKKLKIGDQIYILRAGVLYDMTGKHVQLNRKEGAQ